VAIGLPKPKRITADEVVLSRADWERIVAVLGNPKSDAEQAEDEHDIAAVAAARADDQRLAASIRADVATTIPIDVVKAEIDGAHPVRAWRDHRGWTQSVLASNSGVGRDLIAQIETRRKRGSVGSLDRLARALNIPIEALIEENER
jgi:hypothetical protein